jgi:hypothetical protein
MKKFSLGISILLVLCLANSVWAGLIGHWKFDEGSGTTARDSSGKNNNGRLMNGPTWVTGQLGKALDFDGVDDYVEVPHSAALIPTTGRATVSVWIDAKRHTGPGGSTWQGILAKGGAPRLYNLYTEASGVLHFSTGPSGAYIGPLSTGHVPLNEWVHVAVVVDGRDYFYINGESAGVAGEGATVPTGGTAALTIGQTGESNFFLGMIDDVRLYDRALTAEQVKALFGGNPPVFGKAERPNPADGTTGVLMALLTWAPGESILFQSVYLGTTPDLTAADLVASRLPFTSSMYYHAPGLVSGQKYYWRVDGTDAAGAVFTGDVWSFTAAPVKAYDPSPSDGAKYVKPGIQLTWSPGSSAVFHEVYFGTSQADVAAGDASVAKGTQTTLTFDPGALEGDATYYWRVDEIGDTGLAEVGYVWSFRTLPEIAISDPNLIGWWKLDEMSGPVVVDWSGYGNLGALQGAPQRVPGYDGGALKFNGVDDYVEVPHSDTLNPTTGKATVCVWINAERHTGPGGSTWQGIFAKGGAPRLYNLYTEASGVLHFSTGLSGAYIGSLSTGKVPLNEWVHVGVVVDGKHIFYLNGEPAGEGGQGATVPVGSTVALTIGKTDESNFFLGMIDDVRLYGTALTQAQIQEAMRGDPLLAWGAHPADGSVVDIRDAESLTWQAGGTADQHDVYFGTDAAAVADADTSSPEYKGRQADTSYSLGGLVEFGGGPYYWRVDEVEADAATIHSGHVWTFTVADYLIVDDFEAYTDDVGSRIFQTWIDGWGYTEPAPGNPGNGTGSAVGYGSAPFAEQTIVKSGRQSMPLAYDNADSPYYSETDRTFDTPMDWTVNGMDTLSLQVRGYPELTTTTVTETGGKMSLTGAGADIWGTSDDFTFAYKTLNGDGSILAKVVSNGTGSNTWAKGGVMIRDSLDGEAASAQMCMTGSAGNGAVFQNRASTGLDMGANDATSNIQSAAVVAPPFWVKVERFGDTFTGYTSADGTSWTFVGTREIPMTAPVYIGLCVTSHAAGEDRTFQFEGIKTSGGVSGAWQGAVIASPQYNSPQDLYVVVTDSSNKSATVTDATAVTAADWIEVQMPLSSFTGVNMTRVQKVTIGVGSRTSPTPDGSGKVFIDDIRVIKPEAQQAGS